MIDDLKRLLVIIDEDSLTEAAKTLHLTQPALTHAIKRLEKTMNIKLFRHVGKKLILTPEGAQALMNIERIVKLWDNVVNNTSLSHKKTFTIGTFDNAALILAPLFKLYSKNLDNPLELIINNSEKLQSMLHAGIIDMCICVQNTERKSFKNAKLIKTFTERLVPVSQVKNIQNAEEIPFLLYNSGSMTRKYIDQTFHEKHIHPKIAAESTSPQFLKELAMLGVGVALLPETFISYELIKKRLYEVDLPFHFLRTIGVYLGTESDLRSTDEIVKDVLRYLQE